MTRSRPFVIGITGNIACGKSLVLKTLAELGAEPIDADRVAHAVMRAGTPTWHQIVAHFGQGVIGADQEIDRKALGAIVFADPEQLATLDALVHPATIAEIQRRIEQSGHDVVAVDAIKLFESGLNEACDEVWAVICDPDQQVERLMRRDTLSQEAAMMRIRAQSPQEEKARRSDRVIDNSGTPDDTRRQVQAAWAALPTR